MKLALLIDLPQVGLVSYPMESLTPFPALVTSVDGLAGHDWAPIKKTFIKASLSLMITRLSVDFSF